MEGLSEDLDGKYSIENNNGTKIQIEFDYEVDIKRPDVLTSSFASSN